MRNKPKISIIVPVYNVSAFLRRCLDSIASQTFKDFEVIMINDGSTDNSYDIIRAYAERYDNFHAYTQRNSGVSAVRNRGIELSEGEFVAFVDSDDYISPVYLEYMYRAARISEADVVSCNYRNVTRNGKTILNNLFYRTEGVYSGKEILSSNIKDISVRSYLWNKLWRRSLFTDNCISFPKIAFEDVATVPRLFYFARKVVILNRIMYYYTQRSDSLTGFASPKVVHDYLTAFGIIRNFLEAHGSFKPYRFSFFVFRSKITATTLYWVVMLGLKSKDIKYTFEYSSKMLAYLKYYSGNDYISVHIPSRSDESQYIEAPSYLIA